MATDTNSSLENATAGRYEFKIKAIFSEAWEKVTGIKATFWKAFLCMIIISGIGIAVASAIGNLIEGPVDYTDPAAGFYPVHDILKLLVSIFLTMPLAGGLWIIMIRHISSLPTNFKTVFGYFGYWKKLWAYPTIILILQWAAYFAKEIPAVSIIISLVILFFVITYFMFTPLIVEKNLSIWEAFEGSRKTIFHHWFKMLWLVILLGLIGLLSLCTLGIAFIWTLPWMNNITAVLYRNMFGVQQTA